MSTTTVALYMSRGCFIVPGAMTTAGDSGMEGDEQDHSVKLSQTLQTTHSKRKQAEHLARVAVWTLSLLV